METAARTFARNFRKLRAVAARGKVVRVTAPEGVYLFMREKTAKTNGAVLASVEGHVGHGFLKEDGAKALKQAKHKLMPAKSPCDSRS